MRQMLSVVLALAVIAGACSSNEDTASDTLTPTVVTTTTAGPVPSPTGGPNRAVQY